MKLLTLRSSRAIVLAGAALVLSLNTSAIAKADGGDLFKAKCSMCHGPDGKGFAALKTPDFTDSKWQASRKDKEIEDIIKNGKKDTMMKGFGDKLKEDEIDSLIKYIRTLNSKKSALNNNESTPKKIALNSKRTAPKRRKK